MARGVKIISTKHGECSRMPFIDKPIRVELMEGIETDKKNIKQKVIGKLLKDAQDRISIEINKDTQSFAQLLNDWKNSVIDIEVLQVLEEDQDPKQPVGFEIICIKRSDKEPQSFF